MANVLFLAGRDGAVDSYSQSEFEQILKRITPDNAPRDREVFRNDDTAICIANPSPSVSVRDRSICLGQMLPPEDGWHVPDGPVPDGSYALVRADEDRVELVSDVAASRTLYYHQFEDLFVASSSQRAVMHFFDVVAPSETAMAWMISSGTLGPQGTWDERIRQVPPNATVRLDRSQWELTVETNPMSITPQQKPDTYHREQLAQAIEGSCNALDIDLSAWTLPLSGGVDSRELLLQLQDRDDLSTITWGEPSALDEPESDAARARQLADACNVDHTYHELPASMGDVPTVLDRFLTAGEGRIDHLAGYVDGFELFSSLADSGVNGMIRGDVFAASEDVKTPTHVRVYAGGQLLSDYDTFDSLSVPGRERQTWPERFERRSDESLLMWRDRLYQSYRIPNTLAALTALKLPYVEISNPLLSKRVFNVMKKFPDNARRNKRLYKEYVLSRGPDVPVATASATPDYSGLLGAPNIIDYFHQSLDTARTRDLLGRDVVEWTLDSMTIREKGASGNAPAGTSWPSLLDKMKFSAANRVPTPITALVEEHTPISAPSMSIDPNHLAFRLFLIDSMIGRLRNDVTQL